MAHSAAHPPRAQPAQAGTVLLVADDVASCALFGTLLMKHLDCSAKGASSTEDALAVLAADRIDLVFLVIRDLAAGAEQLRAILRAVAPSPVPVMVVIQEGEPEAHVELLRLGAADAVAFPCPAPEILARTQRLLRQASASQTQAATRRYSLAGDLSGLSLTDLVAVLEYTSGSGVLHLLTARGAGRVYFRRGRATHAQFENLEGRAAFFELLREREAQFEFVAGDWVAGDPRGALEGSNVSLLLEGVRNLDERSLNEAEPDPVQRAAEPAWVDGPAPVPALRPDAEFAETCLAALNNPAELGELHLLHRTRVRNWSGASSPKEHLRIILLADSACGVHVLVRLAHPLAADEVMDALKRPPLTVGLSWSLPGDRTLEILLLDQERASSIVDSIMGSPAVLIVAPSYGDFLTLDVRARSALQSLMERVPPLMVLGVGNGALESQLRDFLKLLRADVPLHALRGSLWKLDPRPRALLDEAIRRWASLPDVPRAEAA